MITFMRSAPYQVTRDNDSLYASFDAMARGRFDPGLLKAPTQTLNVRYDHVIVSDTNRAKYTAERMGLTYVVDKKLAEISFSMVELIAERDFNRLGPETRVDLVRKLFFKKFVNDELDETYAQVVKRIRSVARSLVASPSRQQLVISHSFFMKVFEIACKDPAVLEKPIKLLSYYDGSVRAYGYQEGFNVKQKNIALLLH